MLCARSVLQYTSGNLRKSVGANALDAYIFLVRRCLSKGDVTSHITCLKAREVVWLDLKKRDNRTPFSVSVCLCVVL